MKKASILFLIPIILWSCGGGKYSDYKKSPNGLLYKIIEKKDGHRGDFGDYYTIDLKYETENDSLLFDSRYMQDPLMVEIMVPYYEGDLTEIFSLIGVGDSVNVLVVADSFFIKQTSHRRLPDFITPGSMLKFSIRVLDLISAEEMGIMEQEIEKEIDEQKRNLEAEEAENLKAYLSENKVTVKPTESGLYFISKTKGKGNNPKPGQTVKVNYTGRLLNGKVFDTSSEEVAKANNIFNPQRPYGPLDFVIGKGQVIKGWDEGIALLQPGGTGTLIIPSNLAYGERWVSELITPYSNLIFEVELVTVAD